MAKTRCLLLSWLLGMLVACSGKTPCTAKGYSECKQQCDKGDAHACFDTGEFLFEGTSGDKAGTPVAQDQPRALEYYSKACPAVDDACIALAYAYVAGRGTRVDFNRAIEIADPVCAKGRGQACALIVRAAEGAGIDSSTARKRAIDAYKAECDANRGGAAGRAPCWSLATEGWLPVDEALKYAQITCERGESNPLCKDPGKLRDFIAHSAER